MLDHLRLALLAVPLLGVGLGCADSSPTLPPTLTYRQNPLVLQVGVTMAPDLPAVSGVGSSGFTVKPDLPPGVHLDAVSGTLSGTPTAPAAQASYTVSAVVAMELATCSLTLTVNDLPPG